MRKVKYWILPLFVFAALIFLVLFHFGKNDEKETVYTVTSQQWQEALGDEAHIQMIYRNVTIEIFGGENNGHMILATAGGGLMLDNEAQDMKLICVPSGNNFVSYLYQYSTQEWKQYNGKTEDIDLFLNSYLPGYVDTAMGGLQGVFEDAQYDAAAQCYRITLLKSPTSAEDSAQMHCRVFFENGQLSRLETEIVSQNTTQTLKLYNIGKTKVEAPAQ